MNVTVFGFDTGEGLTEHTAARIAVVEVPDEEFGSQGPNVLTVLRKARYLETEEILRQFARDIGIDFDELDLVLWSMKTGEVLK